MARETKAQKAARVSMLLAEFDEKNRQLRKLEKVVKDLKAEVAAIEPGTYGDWILATGTPREILNQPEARRLLTEQGIAVPTLLTTPPAVVRPK